MHNRNRVPMLVLLGIALFALPGLAMAQKSKKPKPYTLPGPITITAKPNPVAAISAEAASNTPLRRSR